MEHETQAVTPRALWQQPGSCQDVQPHQGHGTRERRASGSRLVLLAARGHEFSLQPDHNSLATSCSSVLSNVEATVVWFCGCQRRHQNVITSNCKSLSTPLDFLTHLEPGDRPHSFLCEAQRHPYPEQDDPQAKASFGPFLPNACLGPSVMTGTRDLHGLLFLCLWQRSTLATLESRRTGQSHAQSCFWLVRKECQASPPLSTSLVPLLLLDCSAACSHSFSQMYSFNP